MPLFEDMIAWAQKYVIPYGEFGLFAVAFAGSSFFPVPPDVILIPLVLLNPSLGLWYALVCLIGSILGAVFGYYIGLCGGRSVLRKIVPEAKILKVEKYFKEYGELAVGIAALTPIPYKVFTISAGMMRMNLHRVIFVSILGRSGRFFPLAFVLMYFGKQITSFLNQYFEVFTVSIATIILIIWWVWKKLRKV